MKKTLEQYLREKSSRVDAWLNRLLPVSTQYPVSIHKAMRYSLFAGGKRIRPALSIAAFEAFGGRGERIYPAACALEMLHTFSLIHDDLPCMDNDDFRRGKPTSHKVFGEALAILAGDALLSHAFTVLSDLDSEKYPHENIIEVIHHFAKATGTCGMISGQVWDMQSENKKISLDDLQNLHRHKTGALITLAVTSPAVLKGAEPDVMDCLIRYSEAIGLCFQVVDDILDIEGDESLGKPIGSDQAKNKSTYPALLGLDGAKKEAKRLLEVALASLTSFDERADPLRAIARFIAERKN